jgi:N-acyl homoserine lactone hydrolase
MPVLLDDVRAIRHGDVLFEGSRWPNYLHVVEHPDGRILVDTGMIDSTPEIDEEWSVRFDPDAIPRDVVCVINTHLDFDHCGGNRLFPGVPIQVQRTELEAAGPHRNVMEWIEFEGASYVQHDGEAEIAAGVRVVPTPGHSPGHQSVLVDTEDGLVIVAGDVGYTWGQFDRSESGQALTALRPRRIWLSHQPEPRDAA